MAMKKKTAVRYQHSKGRMGHSARQRMAAHHMGKLRKVTGFIHAAC